MNPIKSIMAFFHFKGKPIEMEVSSARISKGKAYLNPSDNPDSTFIVHADTIKIIMDNVDENGVEIRPRTPEDKSPDDDDTEPVVPVEPTQPKSPKAKRSKRSATEEDFDFLKKHSFSTKLYTNEMDEVVAFFKSTGAPRGDVLLALKRAVSIRKMNSELKKIQKEHEARQKTEPLTSEE